jgi:hypothetical protein
MIVDSVAANVESTLAFTLSIKIVNMITSIQRSGGGSVQASALDTTTMICVGVLLFATVSIISSSSAQAVSQSSRVRRTSKLTIPVAMRKDMRDIASHVLLLAFSRIAMQQININAFLMDPSSSVDSSVFDYVQKILEIMFVATGLSSILTAVVPAFMESSMGGRFTGIFSGSLANKQLNSLMVNIQRTFAETVSSVITDVQVRARPSPYD